ncbi:phosphodiester glycosidase family protein [Alkalinema pantanalense]|uniref:phosphodiester glycosidase family protein n=1 Tax=Alkalinema pantanalense TaxID=1620705 RepID=UPI003D6F07A4
MGVPQVWTRSRGFVRLGAIGVLIALVGCGSRPSSDAHLQSASRAAMVKSEASGAGAAKPANPSVVQYSTRTIEGAIVHVVAVPAGRGWVVSPALAETVQPIEDFVKQQPGAIAAINAGFFDPENQGSTSFVMRGRQWVADPRQNRRLMENPSLQPYLPQILDRSELRRYRCGGAVPETQYEIVRHGAVVAVGCELLEAIGAGPQLLPQLTATEEGFWAERQGQVIRDAIGVEGRNARSAIGLAADGRVWLVMVAQSEPTGGVSLRGLADLLRSLGADRGLNLDGGTSSALYFQGRKFEGKVDENGRSASRPVKSVLLVKPEND